MLSPYFAAVGVDWPIHASAAGFGTPFGQQRALDSDDRERESERSWYEQIETIRKKYYDLKAINPNAPDTSDKRTPQELMAIIQEAQREIESGLKALMQVQESNQ